MRTKSFSSPRTVCWSSQRFDGDADCAVCARNAVKPVVTQMKIRLAKNFPFKNPCFWLLTVAAFSFSIGTWSGAHFPTPRKVHAQNNRVFELRVYHVVPGRMAALQTLFRDQVVPMFKKHGIAAVGYWVPQDSPESQNTWIYVLVHSSREDAKKNWDAFFADPDWQRAVKAANADGKLTDKIDSTFMDPADISPLK
jgi:hypothetical protein